MFDSKKIAVPCPKCGNKTEKTIGWVKSHDSFACGGCGETISIDKEKLLSGLDEAEKSIAKFRKSIARIGKRR
nr:hypothetical protein [uncultured Shinella sp.]